MWIASSLSLSLSSMGHMCNVHQQSNANSFHYFKIPGLQIPRTISIMLFLCSGHYPCLVIHAKQFSHQRPWCKSSHADGGEKQKQKNCNINLIIAHLTNVCQNVHLLESVECMHFHLSFSHKRFFIYLSELNFIPNQHPSNHSAIVMDSNFVCPYFYVKEKDCSFRP